METIQVNVWTRLARLGEPHSEELARILELGLRQIEETASAKPETTDLAAQKQVVAALQATAGAVGPTPEVTAQYLAKRRARSWKPIAAGGQPTSQMIVERGTYGGVEPLK